MTIKLQKTKATFSGKSPFCRGTSQSQDEWWSAADLHTTHCSDQFLCGDNHQPSSDRILKDESASHLGSQRNKMDDFWASSIGLQAYIGLVILAIGMMVLPLLGSMLGFWSIIGLAVIGIMTWVGTDKPVKESSTHKNNKLDKNVNTSVCQTQNHQDLPVPSDNLSSNQGEQSYTHGKDNGLEKPMAATISSVGW